MSECALCGVEDRCAKRALTCCVETTVSKIKVEEKGMVAVIDNAAQEKFIKMKVDNCLMKDGLRADWLIWRSTVGQVIIELKGRDVEHAVKQVIATTDFLIEQGLCDGKIAALIVSRQSPAASTQMQKIVQEFRKKYRKYNGKMTIKSTRMECSFAALFGG